MAAPSPPHLTCGAEKTIDGSKQPLVCTQPQGHEGPHGVAVGQLPPFVWWGALEMKPCRSR
jgi:hypothetical protein